MECVAYMEMQCACFINTSPPESTLRDMFSVMSVGGVALSKMTCAVLLCTNAMQHVIGQSLTKKLRHCLMQDMFDFPKHVDLGNQHDMLLEEFMKVKQELNEFKQARHAQTRLQLTVMGAKAYSKDNPRHKREITLDSFYKYTNVVKWLIQNK
eukprot:11815994-Karenia_brevis.AAC.1